MTNLLAFQREAERYDLLQSADSLRVDRLARDIADTASEDFDRLDRREQALCRYLATYALRGRQDCWVRAANRAAIDALIRTLKTECGAKFAGLPEAQYASYAAILLHAVLSAHRGVLEGSRPMAPGEYLSIVNGGEE
jgi:hypothetical protein